MRIEGYAALYLQGVERGLGCLCAALAAELDTLPAPLRADLAAFFERHIAWIEQVLRDGQSNGTIAATLAPAAFRPNDYRDIGRRADDGTRRGRA